jgi:hypothetical protein
MDINKKKLEVKYLVLLSVIDKHNGQLTEVREICRNTM